MTSPHAQQLDIEGHVLIPSCFSPATIQQLNDALDVLSVGRKGRLFGARDLFRHVPGLPRLLEDGGVNSLASELLDAPARCVRTLYFAKPPGANWSVPWHQDLSVAIMERHDVEGFGPWSRKKGILHATAPASLLETMVTLRLFLDDCGSGDGPLQIIPKSHSKGRLTDGEIDAFVDRGPVVTCIGPLGTTLAMKPLLCHASPRSTGEGAARRVLHLEYSSRQHPAPQLRWHEG
ncbi:MAG: phytanoyl-CoA dioxygenase family protein [Candidatus Sumerlaeia bacterium]|nr:phytanoyl-CoA dioxygenase family protein [Candidatus Sumerlaeia bacterium]